MNLLDWEVLRFVLVTGCPLALLILASWVCDELSLWPRLRWWR